MERELVRIVLKSLVNPKEMNSLQLDVLKLTPERK